MNAKSSQKVLHIDRFSCVTHSHEKPGKALIVAKYAFNFTHSHYAVVEGGLRNVSE